MTNSISSAAGLDPDIYEALERKVDTGAARAIIVGVYNNDEAAFYRFGQKSRLDPTKPDAETLFEIGSVTKVFTSLLAQVLVDEGVLSWDAPISRYMPAVDFASKQVATITLRELSTHTSGLPRLPDNFAPTDPFDPFADFDEAALRSFLEAYDPDRLHKEYLYSNLAAGLLGEIAAQVVELTNSEAMTKYVLQPMKLSRSSAGFPQDAADQLAAGYRGGADMPNWAGFDAMAGAGV